MPLVVPTAHFLIFLAFNWLLLSLIVYFWWARKRPYPFPTGDCGPKSVALSFLNPTEKNNIYYAIGKIRDREFKSGVKGVITSIIPHQIKLAEKHSLVRVKICQKSNREFKRKKSFDYLAGKKKICFIPVYRTGKPLDPSVDVSGLSFSFSGKKEVDPLKNNILGVSEGVDEREILYPGCIRHVPKKPIN